MLAMPIPGNTKGRSTKIYHILVNEQALINSIKIPDIVREAVQRRYPVVEYKFIFDSIESNTQVNKDDYMPDLTSYLGKINQQPTLHDKHFGIYSVWESTVLTYKAIRKPV